MAEQELPDVGLKSSVFLLLYLAGLDWSRAKATTEEVIGTLPISVASRSPIERFGRRLEFGCMWPYQRSLDFPRPAFGPQNLKPSRAARNRDPYLSTKMERLVACDSETERLFYRRLDQLDEVRWYQEQPLRIDYRDEIGRSSYNPDVLVTLSDGRSVVVEIKEGWHVALFKNVRKYAALASHCEKRGFGVYVGDVRRSLTEALLHVPNAEFKKSLLQRARRRPLLIEDYTEIKDRSGATQCDLIATVLKEGLVLSDKPFRIQAAPRPEEAVFSRFEAWYRIIESPQEVQEGVQAPAEVDREQTRARGAGT